MHGRIGIIAVRVVGDVTSRLTARVCSHCRIAVAIVVRVAIPNRANVTFVNLAIAVVIDSITHLGRSRMDCGV